MDEEEVLVWCFNDELKELEEKLLAEMELENELFQDQKRIEAERLEDELFAERLERERSERELWITVKRDAQDLTHDDDEYRLVVVDVPKKKARVVNLIPPKKKARRVNLVPPSL